MQGQNEQDIPELPVQITRQHRLAAAITCSPAKALGHQNPLWLFCHRHILLLHGHRPYNVCKGHQGNRDLLLLTFLMQFLRIFSFGTINEWPIWERSPSTVNWMRLEHLFFSCRVRMMTDPLCDGIIYPHPLFRTTTLTPVSSAVLVYGGPGKSEDFYAARGPSKQLIRGVRRRGEARCPWIMF